MPSELEQLTQAMQAMGAEPKQAEVMAKQLLKRAEQVSEERGVSKIEALSELLQLVKAGRSGVSYQKGTDNQPTSGD